MWVLGEKQKLWMLGAISNVAKSDFFAKHLNMQVGLLLLLQKLDFLKRCNTRKK